VNSRRFSILITDIADAAFAVDSAGHISAWNNCAAELFGPSEEEAIGVRCHQILQCSDESDVVSEHCVVASVAQNNLPCTNFDLRLKTKTGRLWCNLSTLIASDASGARHAIHIARPCEMRKRLEQALSEFVRKQANSRPNAAALIYSTTRGSRLPLTAREMEILKRLASGHGTRTIAAHLNISSATVNNHIKHILTKLDAHSRLEAIRNAESSGVI
jgi:PAS domain S-box-containing protein